MGGIFLNYRRGDHVGLVGVVDRRLAEYFGRPQVFLDTESIEGGDRYPDTLRERVADADALLAMIHSGWDEASDASGRRLLDKPGDWVRQELEIALASRRAGRTVVIPVLLDDASEPVADDLPSSLRELALCQARRIRLRFWSDDVDLLIPELERHVAATWQPLDAPPRRPPRRPGKWLAVVVSALAALLLMCPAMLAVDEPVPATGTAPTQYVVAIWSLLCMSVPFLANGLVFLGKAWINHLERDLHPAAPATFYGRVGLPIVGIFVLLGVAFGLLQRSWLNVAINLLVGCLGVFWMGARSVREEENDAELQANWPPRLPTPLDVRTLRRAVAVCQNQLNSFAKPLTRQQRDKAEWVLAALEGAVHTLREPLRRRQWLTERWKWSAFYVLWVAATIGQGVAPAVPDLAADPPRYRALMATALVTLISALFSLGTMEFGYRFRRWQRHAAAAEAEAKVARLRQRLPELRTPAR